MGWIDYGSIIKEYRRELTVGDFLSIFPFLKVSKAHVTALDLRVFINTHNCLHLGNLSARLSTKP